MQQKIAAHYRVPSARAKEKFWQSHLSTQQKSGLTQKEYCLRNQLSKSTFSWWKRKLGRRVSVPFSLVPVTVAMDKADADGMGRQSAAGLTVVTRSGERIEVAVGFHPPTLMRVLQTLEGK